MFSLDCEQIWNLGSPEPNFTLEAHQKGVNCVEYFSGGDRPYLITGSDDQTAKVTFTRSSIVLAYAVQYQSEGFICVFKNYCSFCTRSVLFEII